MIRSSQHILRFTNKQKLEEISTFWAPMTMIRNSMEMEHGGSGVELDREKYLESVEFWKTHAIVK